MKIYLIYILILNIFSFILMGIDKIKAIKKQSRISESKLLMISILGGSLGSIVAMFLFRHKINKLRFKLIFLLSLLLHICLIYKFI